ncbi:acyltransferase family protein [Streptomyces sp. NPDC018007]|uniref:acyltransferase family protein n=1 Tax=Streptomyces sp. NPDC018007 TaxID=3365029 RepID=UPI0037934136
MRLTRRRPDYFGKSTSKCQGKGDCSMGDVLRDTGGAKSKRIPKFEGLRGVLALGVVVYHVAFQAGVGSFVGEPGKPFWGVLADGLGVCLPPFFALSGMMLYKPYARVTISGTKRPATGRFLKRRALRILPAYYLLLVFAIPGYNWFEIDSVSDVLRPVLLMHFYLPEGQPMHGIEPTWTVPAEFTFYLALPLIAWIGHRLARGGSTPAQKARRLLLPLAALEVMAIGWVTYTNLPSTGATMQWYWPPYYAGCFAAGMALAIYAAYAEALPGTPGFYRFVIRRPLVCWVPLIPLYLLYATKPIGIPGLGDNAALAQELVDHFILTAFTLLLLAPMTVPGAESRFSDALFTSKPILFLGQISLGVYLWHEIVINLWLRNGSIFGKSPVPTPEFRGDMGFWELFLFTISISVVLATISFYLVEKPLIKFGERGGPPRGNLPPAPAEPALRIPDQRRPDSPAEPTAERT